MKKTYILFLVVTVFIFSAFYNGCSSDSTGPEGPVGETVTTTISGTVFDESNTPLAGVEVKSAGQTIMTNSNGGFIFSNIQVPKSRYVVNATKSGFFRGSYADAPKANGSSNIEIYMVAAGVTETVSAASGGTVEIQNGTGVELSSNSVSKSDGSAYSGNVNVSLAYLDPTSENFSNLIPGGDLSAQRTDNSEVNLYSYGIIKVDMKSDAGENLQIKSGSTSKITVDIPQSMEGTAPATIPLWFYDDATGLWKEEGTATKQGDKYVGTVSHFSDWNCDVPEGTASVKGLVVDCNNLPVPGISVKIGQASTSTQSDGTFERRVPANTAFEVQVLGGRNFGLSSQSVSVSAMSAGTVKDVGTLNIPCPAYVKGIIKCGTDVKYGQVVISWAGGYNAVFTGADGKFSLATDIGKSAQISIYTLDNKYKTLDVTTPGTRGETLDLGVIEVCEQTQVGENKFTLNGGGFNNKTYSFSSDTNSVFGYYDPQDSVTFIFMQQVFAQDTVLFWLVFNGENAGNTSDLFFYLYHNSTVYYASPESPGSAANVLVTKYGGIGGLIEGSFNGVLLDLFGSTSINLTDGKFSVVRIIFGKNNKDKIPRELRDRLKL